MGYSPSGGQFWGSLFLSIGTGLVSAFSVGWLYSYYSKRAEEEKARILEAVSFTGYRGVYNEDDDPAYRKLLSDLIENANETIVFSGVGLSILYHFQRLTEEIAEQAKKKRNLRVKILVADYRNEGVICRQKEEMAALSGGEKYIYTTEWFKSQAAKLNRLATSAKKRNIVFRQLNCYPMLSIVRIDDDYFFAPYGCARSGGRSPRVHFAKGDVRSAIVQFLDNTIDGYEKDSHEYRE
jgi:hypothetical protein